MMERVNLQRLQSQIREVAPSAKFLLSADSSIQTLSVICFGVQLVDVTNDRYVAIRPAFLNAREVKVIRVVLDAIDPQESDDDA